MANTLQQADLRHSAPSRHTCSYQTLRARARVTPRTFGAAAARYSDRYGFPPPCCARIVVSYHRSRCLLELAFRAAMGGPAAPIQFELEANCVSSSSMARSRARHVPATMAGGVAVFDYNRDGRPDIFFTNGANLATLKKDDPKYRNRLFRNDGNGVFTDVTEAAGLAGTRLRQRRGGGRLR